MNNIIRIAYIRHAASILNFSLTLLFLILLFFSLFWPVLFVSNLVGSVTCEKGHAMKIIITIQLYMTRHLLIGRIKRYLSDGCVIWAVQSMVHEFNLLFLLLTMVNCKTINSININYYHHNYAVVEIEKFHLSANEFRR